MSYIVTIIAELNFTYTFFEKIMHTYILYLDSYSFLQLAR